MKPQILKPVHTRQLAAQESKRKHGKKPEIKINTGNKMEIDYFRFYESLYRKEITDWVSARTSRRDPFNPITYPIQQLYKDAMLDNHLQGAIENRILRVLNKEILVKDANGKIDDKLSARLQTRWFRHIIRKGMESKFFGYSLIFIENPDTPTPTIIDFPRECVIPEKGIVLNNPFDPNSVAIKYGEFPSFFLFVSLGSDLIGILERVAPMTIFKRHSWANWDEFEQIFGIPIRIARTFINTQSYKDELQMWLETMGTSSYGIFDKQTDIEIKESNRSDAFNVFYQKILAVNKEISKGIVGQTMTMDDGSSQSQAEVHLKIYDEITNADITDVEDWITDNVFPLLRNSGIDIPEGYYLSIVEKEVVRPMDKIKIDAVLLQSGYNITPEYIEDFYGTPLDKDEPRSAGTSLQLSQNRLESFFA
ncbi:MAG: DUF935 domain-containing protein [Bacteroidetes bacterium]|nr:DUF935 domain-containing protein [Bacteroidota bacterium]